MSSSDVFTAIGTLVALAVAVAGGTLFLIRALRKKEKIGGGDLAIIGFLVLLAIGGGIGAAITIPKVVPTPTPVPPTNHTTSNQNNQTNSGNNNVNMTHSNVYIVVGQNLPGANATPDNNPSSTTDATQNPYAQDMPTSQFNASLRDNTSPGVQWEESDITGNDGGRYICNFYQGYYHAYEAGGNGFTTCLAQQTNFSDFTYEVQMDIMQGNYGGVFFRSQNSQLMYVFLVSPKGSKTGFRATPSFLRI